MKNDYLPPVFEIQFLARLTPSHPQYFELGACVVRIWLFAKDRDDAIERARLIVKQLPYELASEIGKDLRLAPSGAVEMNMLNQIGAAVRIDALVAGSDDDQLIKLWEEDGREEGSQ